MQHRPAQEPGAAERLPASRYGHRAEHTSMIHGCARCTRRNMRSRRRVTQSPRASASCSMRTCARSRPGSGCRRCWWPARSIASSARVWQRTRSARRTVEHPPLGGGDGALLPHDVAGARIRSEGRGAVRGRRDQGHRPQLRRPGGGGGGSLREPHRAGLHREPPPRPRALHCEGREHGSDDGRADGPRDRLLPGARRIDAHRGSRPAHPRRERHRGARPAGRGGQARRAVQPEPRSVVHPHSGARRRRAVHPL